MHSYPRRQDNPYQLSFESNLFEYAEMPVAVRETAIEFKTSLVPVYSVQLKRTGILSSPRLTIRSPGDAAVVLEEYGLPDKDREHLAVMVLDTKNQIIGIHTASIGILDSALISPREVFKAPILLSGASIIIAHNHPSGDPTPSTEDRRITQRISEAGHLLAIELLDHVIIGDAGRFTSLKERGVF